MGYRNIVQLGMDFEFTIQRWMPPRLQPAYCRGTVILMSYTVGQLLALIDWLYCTIGSLNKVCIHTYVLVDPTAITTAVKVH